MNREEHIAEAERLLRLTGSFEPVDHAWALVTATAANAHATLAALVPRTAGRVNVRPEPRPMAGA